MEYLELEKLNINITNLKEQHPDLAANDWKDIKQQLLELDDLLLSKNDFYFIQPLIKYLFSNFSKNILKTIVKNLNAIDNLDLEELPEFVEFCQEYEIFSYDDLHMWLESEIMSKGFESYDFPWAIEFYNNIYANNKKPEHVKQFELNLNSGVIETLNKNEIREMYFADWFTFEMFQQFQQQFNK